MLRPLHDTKQVTVSGNYQDDDKFASSEKSQTQLNEVFIRELRLKSKNSVH